MIELYITGDGLMFWSEAEALEHCEEIRDTIGEFIACECLSQPDIAKSWNEREEAKNGAL